jgi:hypothetical protein
MRTGVAILIDAIGVMPGFVPGIHVVTGFFGFGTPTLSFAAAGATTL